MILRRDIINAARKCLGTPWHHLGRVVGERGGMDCFGLIVYVAHALNYPIHDLKTYGRVSEPELLLATMDKSFDRLDLPTVGVGDVVVFWVEKRDQPRHMGIVTPYGVIHTLQRLNDTGKVVEHGIDGFWDKRLCYAFSFRGVEAVGDVVMFPERLLVQQTRDRMIGGCCG